MVFVHQGRGGQRGGRGGGRGRGRGVEARRGGEGQQEKQGGRGGEGEDREEDEVKMLIIDGEEWKLSFKKLLK